MNLKIFESRDKRKTRLGFATALLLCLYSPFCSAKPKAVQASSAPGHLASVSGGYEIFFEDGRRVSWPDRGPLVLLGPGNSTLSRVDLAAPAKKQTGVEAMGLEVEETDLGGALGSKRYLTGKKKPTGRDLDPHSFSDQPAAGGMEKQASADGINLTTVEYPNGSSLLRFHWPEGIEEIYFDRRKGMVRSELKKKSGPFDFTLKQWSDGSFSRAYRQASGNLTYTYDANDKSQRFTFSNAKGETVQEIVCQESCESAASN